MIQSVSPLTGWHMCPRLRQVQSFWRYSVASVAVCFVMDVFVPFVISETIAMTDCESNSQTVTSFLVTISIVCVQPPLNISGIYFKNCLYASIICTSLCT